MGLPLCPTRATARKARGRPPESRDERGAGRDDPNLLGEDACGEVRSVELDAQIAVVDGAQSAIVKRLSDERGRDAGTLELDADPLDRVAHDLCVVERELEVPFRRSDTGMSAASAASVPASTSPTSRSTARYATVTTFIRGSRPGSP